MPASVPNVRWWPRLGVLCALWVVGLAVAPRASRADCSHPERPSFGIELAPLLGDSPRSAAQRDDDAPARPTPPRSDRPGSCHGPQCSGKSAPAPDSTAAPRVAPGAEAWAALAVDAARDDARLAAGWPEVAIGRPTSSPSSVFHPPRRPR